MSLTIEQAMYSLSQLFMLPVLLAVAGLFFYAFFAVGAFLWQARQRATNDPRGQELLFAQQQNPALSLTDLEAIAVKRLEMARMASRVAPMLGLVATMIPMGPALMALAEGELHRASQNLVVAFSAVILALIAASLTYWTVSVRKRWYATELAHLEQKRH
ncbi:MotA/TolQ/ExbB proton channel family protein [Thiorhodospira sibirica]|uniref:MotA/TolQ/ExbB proton channel family protein n=1 Tax=Thiorhodospira sibirica TaxID=154347 RepID=UPI00022C0B44|nr:MotA/TolQ/ExbB proton channel family protein [Thiorhodospira sibirica]